MRDIHEVQRMLDRFDEVVDAEAGDSDTDIARTVLNWVWNEQYPDSEVKQYLPRRGND